jgi:hypothetical protein
MSKLMSRRAALAVCATAGFVVLSRAPCSAADKTFEISVAGILASEQSDHIDEGLGCLAKECQKRQPRL